MTTLASTIITRVRNQLIDTGTDQRWTDDELLAYLSDAQRAVVAAIPTANTSYTSISLVSGTRQTIPADGYMLLTVIRNASGRAVTQITRDILDVQNPSWHIDTAVGDVRHFFVLKEDPKAFYCYPPSDGTSVVSVVYSAMPPDLASLTDTLAVDDIYAGPLFDYTMYRAHQKDGDYAAGQGVAQAHLAAFAAYMTAQQGGERQITGGG